MMNNQPPSVEVVSILGGSRDDIYSVMRKSDGKVFHNVTAENFFDLFYLFTGRTEDFVCEAGNGWKRMGESVRVVDKNTNLEYTWDEFRAEVAIPWVNRMNMEKTRRERKSFWVGMGIITAATILICFLLSFVS